jgi:subtilisin family serine protease
MCSFEVLVDENARPISSAVASKALTQFRVDPDHTLPWNEDLFVDNSLAVRVDNEVNRRCEIIAREGTVAPADLMKHWAALMNMKVKAEFPKNSVSLSCYSSLGVVLINEDLSARDRLEEVQLIPENGREYLNSLLETQSKYLELEVGFNYRKARRISVPENRAERDNCDPEPTINGKWQYCWAHDFCEVRGLSGRNGDRNSIAILDSGFDLALQDQFLLDPDWKNYPLGCNVFNSLQSAGRYKELEDKYGHGTQVASLAASHQSLGLQGFTVGFSPQSRILPIQVFAEQLTTTNFLFIGLCCALGIEPCDCNVLSTGDCVFRVLDETPSIIVMTCDYLSDNEEDSCVHRVLKYARRKDKLVLCSAGNDGLLDRISYPSAFDEVLAIGAMELELDSSGQYKAGAYSISPFSNKSSDVFAYAPGWHVPALKLSTEPNCCNRTFVPCTGTSYSAPIAAGLVAATFYEPIKFANSCVAEHLLHDVQRGDSLVRLPLLIASKMEELCL